MNSIILICGWVVLAISVNGLRINKNFVTSTDFVKCKSNKYGTIGGQCWDGFDKVKAEIMLKPRIFRHLGDYNPQNVNEYDTKKKHEFHLNVGRALEILRRQLPGIFVISDLDFSIFAPQVTVSDGNGNRLVMQRSLYAGVVKSLRLASTFSFVYPSMNVKKIEYIEDCTTIQCQVDCVLPDSIRIDGQAVWEGMFYFSLDDNGLIQAHTFDKKISTMRPGLLNANSYPWLMRTPQWSAELIGQVGAFKDQLSSFEAKSSSENIKKILSNEPLVEESLLDLLRLDSN